MDASGLPIQANGNHTHQGLHVLTRGLTLSQFSILDECIWKTSKNPNPTIPEARAAPPVRPPIPTPGAATHKRPPVSLPGR